MAADVKTQLAGHSLPRPKAELKPEKKPEHKPRIHGDGGAQKELVTPGIVDFELIREALMTPKPRMPGAYHFGRLSHHSFFSRHHPHPQHVTHMPDFTGKPVCVIRDECSTMPLPQSILFSHCPMGIPAITVPIGDPHSNRNPRLSFETWKRQLKELTSRVAVFTKENELKIKEKQEPLPREQGAKYSAETGRLIPASTQALTRHSFRQGQRSHTSGSDGIQASFLQDQELLVLELLCQILQTDSLSAIQFWLLYAPPKGLSKKRFPAGQCHCSFLTHSSGFLWLCFLEGTLLYAEAESQRLYLVDIASVLLL